MINLCCFLLYACHCSRNPPIQLYWAILYKRLELCTSWQEEWRIYIYKTILSYYSGMLRRAVEFATRENHDMWIYFKKKHNSYIKNDTVAYCQLIEEVNNKQKDAEGYFLQFRKNNPHTPPSWWLCSLYLSLLWS